MSKEKIYNDRWIQKNKIGDGGQGNVFIVVDKENLDKKYTLKLLKSKTDVERRKRMHNEVENIARLNHKHILKIIDSNTQKYDNIEEPLYYVAEYINGETLEKYCSDTIIDFENAKSFYVELLQTLAYCHENGIIHRDIKPDNILICNKNLLDFKIIDFGISFFSDDANCQSTCTNIDQQLGNRFIVLPELIGGSKEEKRNPVSDITQSCGVFFYILTGCIPNVLLDGKNLKPHQRLNDDNKLFKIINEQKTLDNINYIFDKGFNHEVQERYTDIQELITDLNNIHETRVDISGGPLLNTNLSIPNNTSSLLYSELINSLNPHPFNNDPKGLTLPPKSNITELINLAVAIPEYLQNSVKKLYSADEYFISAQTVWIQAIDTLRKRILSLGKDFVGDMIGSNDKEYIENLPPYRVVCLANELGFINDIGMQNLISANDIYNKCKLFIETKNILMPEDEANIVIKYSIAHVLYTKFDNNNWKFNDFRNKLKSSHISQSSENDLSILVNAPYFYKKTTVRSLVNLFTETDGIEFEFVSQNLNSIIPVIWSDLENDERRAITHLFEKYHSENNIEKANFLKRLLLNVKGFDYVTENLRSNTFVETAKKLIDVHFGYNNFYNEPVQIKYLSELGTKIPPLAVNICMRATIYVKVGNSFGVSYDAQKYADTILDSITEDQWILFLEKYVFEDIILYYLLSNPYSLTRRNWINVVGTYKLDKLNLSDKAKKIL